MAEGVTDLSTVCFCFLSVCHEKASFLLEGAAEVNKEEDRKLKIEACET